MASQALAREALPPEAASVRRVRRVVAGALEGRVGDDLLDAALLVATELSTNALLHAGTAFEVVVRHDDGDVRLEVHDGSGELPRRKRYSTHAATGRGLAMVDALCAIAGADRTDGGKVVWAVLSEQPPAPPLVGSGDAADVTSLPGVVPGPGSVPGQDEVDLQVAASAEGPDPAGTAGRTGELPRR